jgi:ribosomal protein S18 acetylase RimI-like enzyme
MGQLVGCALGGPGGHGDQRGAAAFYERLGFADTGERYPLRDGSDLTTRVMRREP